MGFFFLPIIFFSLILIPTFLIYDFGIYFITYLNGASSSSSFAATYVFDFISFCIFYFRLIIQNIRLFLIIFTFINLQDLIIFFDLNSQISYFYDNSYNINLYNLNNYNYYISYFLKYILYYIFEFVHMLFIVVLQFFAFFAMTF